MAYFIDVALLLRYVIDKKKDILDFHFLITEPACRYEWKPMWVLLPRDGHVDVQVRYGLAY